MRFLGRLMGRDEPPEWASFLQPAQFEEFIATVDAEMEATGRPYEIDPEAGVARFTDAGAEGTSMGLLNIAQVCGQIPEAEWAEAAHAHFSRLFAVGESSA